MPSSPSCQTRAADVRLQLWAASGTLAGLSWILLLLWVANRAAAQGSCSAINQLTEPVICGRKSAERRHRKASRIPEMCWTKGEGEETYPRDA
ncbi:hypothetical protein GN956_G6786 [Arapaima gigas]